jgi:phosphoesterase RecJ-like protein
MDIVIVAQYLGNLEQINKNNNRFLYIANILKENHQVEIVTSEFIHGLKKHNKEVYVLLEESDRDILSWIDDYSFICYEIKNNNYAFVALDVNDKKRLGKFSDGYLNASIRINIDHHQGNDMDADYTYSSPSKSSTSEMIYELFEEDIDMNIATYLYSGILNDTNGFKRRISSSTLSIAQELINFGVDYENIIKKTLTNRSLYEFKALGKMVNDIKYDSFHYLVVDMKEDCYKDLSFNQITKRIAEDLRTIEGIDIFILLIKYDGYIKSKCMSNISENANVIAGLFNGGGHKKEAGFTVVDMDIDEILYKIKGYLK